MPPTDADIAEVVEHVGQQISRYLDGGPDPRGPGGIDLRTLKPIWPTRACWQLGAHLRGLAIACRQAGYDKAADRATELLGDLHGRAQSPEELTAMMKFTGTVD